VRAERRATRVIGAFQTHWTLVPGLPMRGSHRNGPLRTCGAEQTGTISKAEARGEWPCARTREDVGLVGCDWPSQIDRQASTHLHGSVRAMALSTLTLGHCHARMGNTSHNNVSWTLTLYERLQGSRTHSTGSGDGIPFVERQWSSDCRLERWGRPHSEERHAELPEERRAAGQGRSQSGGRGEGSGRARAPARHSSLTGQRKTREKHAVAGKRRNTPNSAGTRNSTGANGGQGGAWASHGV